VFFKEVECSVWRDAGVLAVGLHDGIKINGDICILDQMLVVGVSAILSNHSFTGQVKLKVLNLLFIKICNNFEPGIGNQKCKLVSFSFVQFHISGIFQEDRNILGGNHPLSESFVE